MPQLHPPPPQSTNAHSASSGLQASAVGTLNWWNVFFRCAMLLSGSFKDDM